MRKILFLIVIILAATEFVASATTPTKSKIMRRDTMPDDPMLHEMVIVHGDTVPMIMSEPNYGRFNRGLYNFLYVPRRTWAFGLTASYGSLNTDDVQILSLIKNIDFGGKLYSLKPSVAYFFKNNQSVGVRLDYTRGSAELGSLALDIDEDMNFKLHDIAYNSDTYKVGVFYRNYVGLGKASRFAVFNEVAAEFGTGTSQFKRYYGETLYDTKTYSTSVNLNFSPGVCVFIMDYAAFNVSFGVFGLHVTKDKQLTNGEDEGSRVYSGANFRFNLFNINFGILIVI